MMSSALATTWPVGCGVMGVEDGRVIDVATRYSRGFARRSRWTWSASVWTACSAVRRR